MHRLRPIILALVALLITAVAAFAGGPPSGTIYAHDLAYRTVGTPTDFPNRGQFNAIYTFEGLASVSEAAPGDRDWRGGRWEVHAVQFVTIAPRQFTNAEDLKAAAARGEVSIGPVVRHFECPLIRK